MSEDIDWETIVEELKQPNACLPVISNRFMGDLVFPNRNVVDAWATLSGYPLQSPRNLARVAQYRTVIYSDIAGSKKSYLRSLQKQLLDYFEAERFFNEQEHDGSEDVHDNHEDFKNSDILFGFSKLVKQELEDTLEAPITFSDLVCDRLQLIDTLWRVRNKYDNNKALTDNPLNLLAKLKIPIFLTTSPHRFLEKALTAAGKEPQTQVYLSKKLRKMINDSKNQNEPEFNVLTQLQPAPKYDPTVEKPLVFHLHGIEDSPNSLVLTEDDYLEFLVSIIQDWNDTQIIPNKLRTAVSRCRILLIGYCVHAWDFRVLVHSLLKDEAGSLRNSKNSRHWTIQLKPQATKDLIDPESYKKYLKQYFDQTLFNVYWGSPQCFLQEIWKRI